MVTLCVSVCLAHAVLLFVYLCVLLAHAMSERVCVYVGPTRPMGVNVCVCTIREDRQGRQNRQEQEEPGGSKYFANFIYI